jgi:membrane-bound lytic murein transglycosylase D
LKSKGKTQHYVIRRGDTLADIAQKFDVEVSQLQHWNKLKGSRITPGRTLIVAKPNAA